MKNLIVECQLPVYLYKKEAGQNVIAMILWKEGKYKYNSIKEEW